MMLWSVLCLNVLQEPLLVCMHIPAVIVSAFTGLEKSKAFKLMTKNVDYIKPFEYVGKNWLARRGRNYEIY